MGVQRRPSLFETAIPVICTSSSQNRPRRCPRTLCTAPFRYCPGARSPCYSASSSDTHSHRMKTQAAVRMLAALEVEQVIHCGDVGSGELVSLFDALADAFVFGNVDDPGYLRRAIAAGRTDVPRTFRHIESGRNSGSLFCTATTASGWKRPSTAAAFDLVCHGIRTWPARNGSARRWSSTPAPCTARTGTPPAVVELAVAESSQRDGVGRRSHCARSFAKRLSSELCIFPGDSNLRGDFVTFCVGAGRAFWLASSSPINVSATGSHFRLRPNSVRYCPGDKWWPCDDRFQTSATGNVCDSMQSIQF